MLKIKLSRTGLRNRPIFRIIVQEDSFATKGKYLEKVGVVDRIDKVIKVNKERVLHWIGLGAQPTDTVHNILIKQKIVEGKKRDISKQARLRKKRKEAATPAAESAPAPSAPQPTKA